MGIRMHKGQYAYRSAALQPINIPETIPNMAEKRGKRIAQKQTAIFRLKKDSACTSDHANTETGEKATIQNSQIASLARMWSEFPSISIMRNHAMKKSTIPKRFRSVIEVAIEFVIRRKTAIMIE